MVPLERRGGPARRCAASELMPYITLSANGEELDRVELTDRPIVVGRACECDVSLHDILMSRRHCRIEPYRAGWKLVDLNSKNGTRIGWSKVQEQVLLDGHEVRIGRTLLTYSSGPFVAPVERSLRRGRVIRPADPHEALSGTVAGFTFVEPEPRSAGVADQVDFEAIDSSSPPPSSPLIHRPGAVHGLGSGLSTAVASMPSRAPAKAAPRPIVYVNLPTPEQVEQPSPSFVEANLILQALPEHAAPAPALFPDLSPAPATPTDSITALARITAIAVALGATGVVLFSAWALSRV